MRNLLETLILLASVLGLSSCSTWDKLNDTERGAVIGGGSGAVIGGIASESSGGALLGGAGGALVGGIAGHEMDRDRRDR